ncbi:unnamed protein product [Notodromas monacha]|uniref:Microtubule-associated protein Jupiter n=1 Tax=Notodromas monacha TaxID=399045 RepID=A0A7R9BMZ5_9CRUS|nr:unnamed protein product [Notodromas monacha]CAG0917114.1 unnamed protein product [Notodromas monacha]
MSAEKKSVLRTPNSRLFDTNDDIEASRTPRRVKNYMKSSIFDEPSSLPVHQNSIDQSDSGSETASNDGDRLSTSTTSSIGTPSDRPRGRVPPGGYASKLW